jgi:hypothetical protein
MYSLDPSFQKTIGLVPGSSDIIKSNQLLHNNTHLRQTRLEVMQPEMHGE